LHQRAVILDGGHAPHAADDEGAVAQEAGRSHGGGRPQARVELHAVDAIADVRHPRGRGADDVHQPVPQVGADGDEMLDQRQQAFAQQPVLAAGAVQVADVAPVLAMHAQAHAGQPGQQLRLDAAQVARVHDGRLQPLDHAVQAQVVAPVLAFALAQADDFHARRRQALAEGGGVLQADDGVAVASGRQVVDHVDEAVFQPAHVELVDHVHDQRRAVAARAAWRVPGIAPAVAFVVALVICIRRHAAAPAGALRWRAGRRAGRLAGPRAAAAPQPRAQPDEEGQQQQGQRPRQRHFQHLGAQVEEDGQRHEAEDGQIAAVGQEMPDSSQHDEPRVRSHGRKDAAAQLGGRSPC